MLVGRVPPWAGWEAALVGTRHPNTPASTGPRHFTYPLGAELGSRETTERASVEDERVLSRRCVQTMDLQESEKMVPSRELLGDGALEVRQAVRDADGSALSGLVGDRREAIAIVCCQRSGRFTVTLRQDADAQPYE